MPADRWILHVDLDGGQELVEVDVQDPVEWTGPHQAAVGAHRRGPGRARLPRPSDAQRTHTVVPGSASSRAAPIGSPQP